MAAYQASESQGPLHELVQHGSGSASGECSLVRTACLPEQLFLSDYRRVEASNDLEHPSDRNGAPSLGGH